MGVAYIKRPSENSVLGIRGITESVQELLDELALSPYDFEIYKHKKKDARKKEWLASRNMLKSLLGQTSGIHYNEEGKPSLNNSEYHVSISHSEGYVAVYLDSTKEPGVDIQKMRPIPAAGLDFFLNSQEMKWMDPKDNLSVVVAWSAKEAVFKVQNSPELDLKKDITIEPFIGNQNGLIKVNISTKLRKKELTVHFEILQDYVLTYTV